MKSLLQKLLYPFLFALYPIIALLAYNLDQVSITQTWRSMAIVLGLTAILIVVFRLLTKDWYKAGLITSLCVIIFLGYGHVINAISQNNPKADIIVVNKVVTSICASFLVLGGWAIWQVMKPIQAKNSTNFLNIIAITIMVWPLYSIIIHEISNQPVQAMHIDNAPPNNTSNNRQTPDIYYIILDGYTRGDILQEVFNFDNGDFLGYLQNQGFFVAEASYANYAQTLLSLSSSLNMSYVNQLPAQVGDDSTDRNSLVPLIRNSAVINFLDDQGYTIVGIDPNWYSTSLPDADIHIKPELNINKFEGMWLELSMFGTLYGNTLSYELKRQHVEFVFNSLATVATIQEQKFVFAHIWAPHIPSVFGPNGEAIQPKPEDLLKEVFMDPHIRDIYIADYVGELQYLNHRLEETIDSILEESETPPIIILQGDHGSRAYLDWTSAQNSCMRERLAILNAYYLPNIDESLVYNDISPVNSFRIIFDHYFDTNFDLISDERSYFSTWQRPYQFIDVTDQLETPCQE